MIDVYTARKTGRKYCNDTEGSKHYVQPGVEAMDLIISLGYHKGYCLGSAIKYLSRFKRTKQLGDLRKASDMIHIYVGAELKRRGVKLWKN